MEKKKITYLKVFAIAIFISNVSGFMMFKIIGINSEALGINNRLPELVSALGILLGLSFYLNSWLLYRQLNWGRILYKLNLIVTVVFMGIFIIFAYIHTPEGSKLIMVMSILVFCFFVILFLLLLYRSSSNVKDKLENRHIL